MVKTYRNCDNHTQRSILTGYEFNGHRKAQTSELSRVGQ